MAEPARAACAQTCNRRAESHNLALLSPGDEDPLFAPEYYKQYLQTPLRSARVSKAIDSSWVRLPYGDHALCRYRRRVVGHVTRFALKCVGAGVPVDLFRVGRELLSWRGLLDPVPFMLIVSMVTGFLGGQFYATPEGKQVFLEHEADLDRRRSQAIESPDTQIRL